MFAALGGDGLEPLTIGHGPGSGPLPWSRIGPLETTVRAGRVLILATDSGGTHTQMSSIDIG